MKLALLQMAYTKESQLPRQGEVPPNTLYNSQPDKSHEDHLPPYIKRLDQSNLLICRVHDICLTRKGLSDHLLEAHSMSEEKSRQAFRAAWELHVAGTRSEIIFPPPEAPPIQGLKVQPGYMCTAETGCPFLSPQKDSLYSHLSRHGIHRKDEANGALYNNVSIQNLFPGKRPLYIIVNGTPENLEGDSAAGKAGVGRGNDPGAGVGVAADGIAGPSGVDNGACAKSRELADREDSPRAPLEEGLGPSPETTPSSPANRPSPAEFSGPLSISKPSAPLILPAGISSPSQPILISEPMPTSILFSHTVFRTKREDTGRIHICLASDIRAPRSNTINLNPSRISFESYCGLLKREGILDQEGQLDLVFHPAGGERIPILDQMMFCTAVTYQMDRKVDMVAFSAIVRREGWFRFW